MLISIEGHLRRTIRVAGTDARARCISDTSHARTYIAVYTLYGWNDRNACWLVTNAYIILWL